MQVLRDYATELKGSPVKSGAVALLLAVGLLLWGRLLLKEVPRTASAWEQVADNSGLGVEGRSRFGDEVEVVDPGPLVRNLFELDPSHYRRTRMAPDESVSAKSGDPTTENDTRAAVLSAAAKLRLTSVIEGEDPVVMIDNRLLRRGDTIKGFTVVGFEGRAVILEQHGVKVRVGL